MIRYELITRRLKYISLTLYQKEAQSLTNQINREREHQIDSCIIRIMKSRRKLDLSSIEAETMKLIALFDPEPKMIKRRIESLIEREYLGRDETER